MYHRLDETVVFEGPWTNKHKIILKNRSNWNLEVTTFHGVIKPSKAEQRITDTAAAVDDDEIPMKSPSQASHNSHCQSREYCKLHRS